MVGFASRDRGGWQENRHMDEPSKYAVNASEAVRRLMATSPSSFDDSILVEIIEQAVASATEARKRKERKRAARIEAAAQRRLVQMLGASPAVVYSFAASGDYAPIFVSSNIDRVFGYEPSEYMENSNFWRERVHPDDLKWVEAEIARMLGNGAHALEYRFRRKDGSYCWVSDEQNLVCDEGGQPLEIVGSWSDITARREAETAKATAHTRLLNLLAASPAVIYSFEAKGDFRPTFISPNIKEVLGYDPHEYLEHPDFWRSRVHPEDLPAAEAEFNQLMASGRHSVSYRFRRPDGNYCWVNDEWLLVRDENGEPLEVVGSWSDITKRKEADEAAQAMRERADRLLARAPAVIYAFRAKDDFGPTFISKNLNRIFGYASEEYLRDANFWISRVHPDDLTRVNQEFPLLFERDKVSYEYRFRRADGSYCWVGDRLSLVRDAEGQPLEVVGSWSDITTRKLAEEKAAQAHRMILESLRYASRIQAAMLPARQALAGAMHDYFLIWQPRDIVGGDFFWFHRAPHGYYVIVGDCTGHGVPGAFMTLIACGLLDRHLRADAAVTPGVLLSRLHRDLKEMLGQDTASEGDTDDGFEAGVCFVDDAARRMTFAGAHFALWRAMDGTLDEIKGSKPGIGYRRLPLNAAYDEFAIDLIPGQAFYMTTDGLIDQIGGERRRSFGWKRFIAAIGEGLGRPMAEQRDSLLAIHTCHQGEEPRRDDLTVLGFIPLAE
jgi:PAS domain S-box-containing protein